jgi:hypothetical protein
MNRQQREIIARRRLARVLHNHIVANARTLEQKISDAGPSDQRIDPHILTRVRNAMVREGEISKIPYAGTNWFALPQTNPALLNQRLAEQALTTKELAKQSVSMRIGQTLEIATCKALQTLDKATFLGRFKDLDEHDDQQRYRKEEPPQHLGSCGVIIHQTYNQLFPSSEQNLAERARHKLNLGYHDIRVGNAPDARLLKFIGQNLLAVAEDASSRFEEYKDLLASFVADDTGYEEFAARVRRRERGLNEDSDWEEGDPADWEYS